VFSVKSTPKEQVLVVFNIGVDAGAERRRLGRRVRTRQKRHGVDEKDNIYLY